MNNPARYARREFLLRTAAATTATAICGLNGSTSVAAEYVSPPISVFSKIYQELKLNFDQAAELTAEAGLDGIDCPVRPGGEIEPSKAKDLMPQYAAALEKRKLKMWLLTTAILSPSTPNAEDVLRTAKKLGIRYYRLGMAYHDSTKPLQAQKDEIRAQLKDLAAMNKEIGVCALYQNHRPGSKVQFGGDLNEMYELVNGFNPAQIGVAFDLGHAIVVHGKQWGPLFNKLKPYVQVAYVKDVNLEGKFVKFGEGEFSKTDWFTQLRKMNYANPFSLHIEFEWAGKTKTREDLLKALKASTQTLHQWIDKA